MSCHKLHRIWPKFAFWQFAHLTNPKCPLVLCCCSLALFSCRASVLFSWSESDVNLARQSATIVVPLPLFFDWSKMLILAIDRGIHILMSQMHLQCLITIYTSIIYIVDTKIAKVFVENCYAPVQLRKLLRHKIKELCLLQVLGCKLFKILFQLIVFLPILWFMLTCTRLQAATSSKISWEECKKMMLSGGPQATLTDSDVLYWPSSFKRMKKTHSQALLRGVIILGC